MFPKRNHGSRLDRLLQEKELKIMADLIQAMSDLGTVIANLKKGGNLPPEVATHLQAIDDHLVSVDGLESATKNDLAAVKDAQQKQADALQAFLDSAGGDGTTTTGTPTGTPAPTQNPNNG